MPEIEGVDLSKLLSSKKISNDYFTRLFIVNLVIEAVIKFHSENLVHHDLKTQNIMLDLKTPITDSTCTLVDLGCVLQVSERPTDFHGTFAFFAPDRLPHYSVILGGIAFPPSNKKQDYFSLAGVIAGLFGAHEDTYKRAYLAKTAQETLNLIYKNDYNLSNLFVGIKYMPAESKSVIRRIIQQLGNLDPALRPNSLKVIKNDIDRLIKQREIKRNNLTLFINNMKRSSLFSYHSKDNIKEKSLNKIRDGLTSADTVLQHTVPQQEEDNMYKIAYGILHNTNLYCQKKFPLLSKFQPNSLGSLLHKCFIFNNTLPPSAKIAKHFGTEFSKLSQANKESSNQEEVLLKQFNQ